MSSKTILAGGNYQDTEGNDLSNGYLHMVLSQDASANQNTQVAGGRKLKILLDGAGNVITSPAQAVWGNDVLSPAGTYYTVSGYTADGQRVWGPNQVQVTSGSSEFDVGTWVPIRTNVIPSGTIIINEQQILLETNGVPNASQNTLNLIAGSNILLTVQVGGGVIITSVGGGGSGLTPFEGVPSGSIPGSVFVTPVVPVQCSVTINGLTMTPGIGYSIAGDTITLTTELETGDSIYVRGWF